MKIALIAVAVVCFAATVCYWFGIIVTYHPRRAAISAIIGVLALVWMRYRDSKQIAAS
jgi:uncharacterized membrane protein